jgi:2-dehydro-3-deoxyphosphogluconate aldolase/(4S)-4-hydroxy-2-oxoglutarate aldolase
MAGQVLKTILDEKIVAIIRGMYGQVIISLAQAYVDGGIHCMEITLDQTSAENRQMAYATIKAVSLQMGVKMCVGAGTVMNAQQVKEAVEAGAEFIVSPNTDWEVIAETKRLGKVSVPGAFTPTEIAQAHKLGADLVKIFPANMLGPSYIKSIKAPLKHIPFLATGGVTPENIGEYLKAGSAGAGVAGNLVNTVWIQEGRFDKIRETAAAYVQAIHLIG